MICDKCFHVEKNQAIDMHGNIHIAWRCKQTLRLVFSQVIYSAVFLQKLKNGELSANLFYEAGFLPKDKSIKELKHIEVLHRRKSKTCKHYKFQTKPLAEYLK